MKKTNKIVLTKEKKDDMMNSIKEYFYKEREEELGDLAAAMVLNFIIDELAAEFYNQGIFDAYKYMNDRAEDLLGLQK
jgi:uncharacterized protein (DUF2164 family)